MKPHRYRLLNDLLPVGVLIALAIAIGLVSFIVLRVDDRVEGIEEQLTYRPPDTTSAEPASAIEAHSAVGATLYVPVYSHIYRGSGQPALLATTLSIRNTDPSRVMVLRVVDYYDTQGNRLRRYVEQPLRVRPLQTIEYLVEEQDVAGGSGANFIVEWSAPEPVSVPLVETVMVGGNGISIVRPAVVIDTHGLAAEAIPESPPPPE